VFNKTEVVDIMIIYVVRWEERLTQRSRAATCSSAEQVRERLDEIIKDFDDHHLSEFVPSAVNSIENFCDQYHLYSAVGDKITLTRTELDSSILA